MVKWILSVQCSIETLKRTILGVDKVKLKEWIKYSGGLYQKQD